MTANEIETFTLANRAFGRFTLAECEQALRRFTELEYPSLADRWLEAVEYVIREARRSRWEGL